MEAMILGYPPEQKGQISVTATKEEWRQILTELQDVSFGTEAGDELTSLLEQMGVDR